METIVANLIGNLRRETLRGREHMVAPLTLIVPGVLSGSEGPIYYPAEEIGKNPSVWNHIPLVVYHPTANGQNISARNQYVLDKQSVGILLNVATDSDKLIAEGWFDVSDTARVDNRVLERLEKGESIELSTGLFTDNESVEEGATFNGKPYTHIARNYRPDHLAILPDLIGACSIKDGCGVMVNEEKRKGLDLLTVAWHRLADLIGGSTTNDSSSRWIGFTGTSNDHSHSVQVDDGGNGLAGDKDGHTHSITNYVVIANDGHTHSLSKQSLADTGIKNENNTKTVNKEEADMVTKVENHHSKLVDSLIANCDCWSEEDREVLNSFKEEKLNELVGQQMTINSTASLLDNVKKGFEDSDGAKYTFNYETSKWDKELAKKEEPVANKEEKPQTAEEWLAAAPEGVRNTFAHAKGIEDRERVNLISQLTANVADADKEKISTLLSKNGTDELRTMLALVPNIETITPALLPSYIGSAPATNVDPKQEEELKNNVIPIETIDWAEEAKARRQA